MIVVEDILTDIFNQLPTVLNEKVNFSWGNDNILNLYLSQFTSSKKYPLIWLVEDEEEHSLANERLERKTRLILATKSNYPTNTNPIIWQNDFKNILNPLYENVIAALSKSGVTFILNEKVTLEKRSNYSEDGNKSCKTIDNWNVIYLKLNIEFNNKACINNIRF